MEQVRVDALAYFGQLELIGPRLLRHRPSTVEMMTVHVGFEVQVADWCGGVPVYGRGVVVWTANGDLAHADYGDHVVRGARGTYSVVTDRDIFADYESVVA